MPPAPLPLKDIHLPAAIGDWPPAPGWWLLPIITILLLLSLFLLYRLYRRLTRKTALKTAKKLLAALKQDVNKDNRQKLAELSMLLRRVVISIAPAADTAGLTGATWLAFLDASMKDTPFTNGVGAYLGYAPYQPTAIDDAKLAELIALCENWLNKQSLREKPL